ncbi:isochorismatase family protein [Halovenus marina]|uniref:isochorismatase family protein n=1 Tax=Halovenus marina TaxID=3396621 RepID=UPI003F55F487
MVSDRFEAAYIPDVVPETDLDHLDSGGYGARMGWGDSPAVLVVDMLKLFADSEFLGRSEESTGALAGTKRLLAAAREADIPIYYTKLADDEATFSAHRGIVDLKKEGGGATVDLDAASTIHPEVAPEPDDIVVEKAKLSAFFDTHLSTMLRHEGIDTLVVAGLSTSGGIRSTVVEANSHNFRPIVAQECVSDRSVISHEISLFDIDMKYGDVESLDTIVERFEQ